VFLKRNKKISDYQRLIYSNLLAFTKQIIQCGPSQKKLEKLKQTIEVKRQTADIQWLLEKIDEGGF
jgi:hypothetical protein